VGDAGPPHACTSVENFTVLARFCSPILANSWAGRRGVEVRMEPAYPAVPTTTRVMTAEPVQMGTAWGYSTGGYRSMSRLPTTRLPGCSYERTQDTRETRSRRCIFDTRGRCVFDTRGRASLNGSRRRQSVATRAQFAPSSASLSRSAAAGFHGPAASTRGRRPRRVRSLTQ
jgi:hypothetical protein